MDACKKKTHALWLLTLSRTLSIPMATMSSRVAFCGASNLEGSKTYSPPDHHSDMCMLRSDSWRTPGSWRLYPLRIRGQSGVVGPKTTFFLFGGIVGSLKVGLLLDCVSCVEPETSVIAAPSCLEEGTTNLIEVLKKNCLTACPYYNPIPDSISCRLFRSARMTGTAVSTFTTIHGTPRGGAVDADAPAADAAAPRVDRPAPKNRAKFW